MAQLAQNQMPFSMCSCHWGRFITNSCQDFYHGDTRKNTPPYLQKQQKKPARFFFKSPLLTQLVLYSAIVNKVLKESSAVDKRADVSNRYSSFLP